MLELKLWSCHGSAWVHLKIRGAGFRAEYVMLPAKDRSPLQVGSSSSIVLP